MAESSLVLEGGGGLNDMTILSGKYNCLTYFYELLKTHFDDYFKNNGL